MNKSKFDKVVENRAQERVVARINKFRNAVGQAFRDLHPSFAPNYYSGWRPDGVPDGVASIMKIMADGGYMTPRLNANSSYGEPRPWPLVLWTDEEAAVQKELLATMDEMQKALCAPDAATSEIRPDEPPAK